MLHLPTLFATSDHAGLGNVVTGFIFMSLLSLPAAWITNQEEEFDWKSWTLLLFVVGVLALCLTQLIGSERHSENGGGGFILICYVPCVAGLAGPIIRHFSQQMSAKFVWSLYLLCFSVGHFLAWYMFQRTGCFVCLPLAGLAAFVVLAALARKFSADQQT